jgi:hypothetical protein
MKLIYALASISLVFCSPVDEAKKAEVAQTAAQFSYLKPEVIRDQYGFTVTSVSPSAVDNKHT